MGCGGWHARTAAPGTSTRHLDITATTTNCTIPAGPAFTTAITMAAPLVRAGRGRRSDRSGIAADEAGSLVCFTSPRLRGEVKKNQINLWLEARPRRR